MSRNSLVIITLLFIFLTQIQNVNSQTYWQNNGYNRPNNSYKPVFPAGTYYNNYSSSVIQNQDNHENVIIILDSSYSMEDKIRGERKIDIAKRTINQVLSQLSPHVWVGLRVYGHKSGLFGFNACRVSELKVPIGPNTKTNISNELLNVHPQGMTPISYSIQQAVNSDFMGMQGKKRIILVSDGMETCDGSPCDYAVSLMRNKIDLKIDVIGFGINEPIANSQLKCVALSTKGKYYTANDADSLTRSLVKSLNISKDVQGVIIKR